MKRIKRPVYEEVLECEYCGSIWLTKSTAAEFAKCSVCKKEGCSNCSSWTGSTGKKYTYHFKCEKKLPKSVLKAKQKAIDKYDAQQEWSEYVNR